MTTRRRSPLFEVNARLGARFTDFAGWEMPLHFAGVVAEHRAVRTAAGVFDVSHLGKLRVSGAEHGEALQHAVTADVQGLSVGRARYALVLAEDGGCIDDLFIYRIADEEWLVVPNAANVGAVLEAIRASAGDATDEWDRWAILALQGPRSLEVFGRVVPRPPQLRLHQWTRVTIDRTECVVARTGYTGERGFEIYAPADGAAGLYERIIGAGAVPVGLGARDTLRLEMGYALHGHELSLEINPLEANLGWAIAWDTAFRGRDALLKLKDRGPQRRLFGMRCVDRGVPRQGYTVHDERGPVGVVTSGNHSPTLGTGIALALGPIDRVPAPGAAVAIEARGRKLGAEVVEPPFVKK